MAFDPDNPDFPFITCDSCGRSYESYDKQHRQAYGCAADVDLSSAEIQGYYGSTVADMTIFRISQFPDWLSEGDICDDCIVRLLDLGYIIEDRQEDLL